MDQQSDPTTTDEAVPATTAGSVTLDVFRSWLHAWLHAPAMRELVRLSGWEVPSDLELYTELDELAARSIDWDFRSGAERHSVTKHPATVNGRALAEHIVVRCARALGLADSPAPTGPFSHVVVLGGMVRACKKRTDLARELARSLGVDRTAVLTAERPLPPVEIAAADELGWGPLELESDAALAAASDAFGLPDRPDELHRGSVTPTPGGTATGAHAPYAPDTDELDRRHRWSWATWTAPAKVDVVAAPSGSPLQRRTTSADQLAFWAERAGAGPGDRVLVVTTQHYVPYTQLTALRVLSVPRRCQVVTVGTPWTPSGRFRGAGYLQEIRSALQAAQALVRALDAT